MPIIIEGPDGAGKSTLAKSLAASPRIGNGDAEALTEFCGLVGIPIIVLLPPPHVVISRLNERGDEYADVVCPNIVEIYQRYQEWVEEHDNAIVPEDNDPATAMVEVLKCML